MLYVRTHREGDCVIPEASEVPEAAAKATNSSTLHESSAILPKNCRFGLFFASFPRRSSLSRRQRMAHRARKTSSRVQSMFDPVRQKPRGVPPITQNGDFFAK